MMAHSDDDLTTVLSYNIRGAIVESITDDSENNSIDILIDARLDGELTIKNITHPISFYSKIEHLNGKLSANAEVVFDRSLYNVKFGSGKFFDNLGDRLIYDEISIDVLMVTI
mgnify:CR=1 FL=1